MIHESAIISKNAEISSDIQVGVNCIIGDNVKIGKKCILKDNVRIVGNTTIGTGNIFFSNSVIGEIPQDKKYLGENIVIYRKQDGAPAALEDACPHRKLPLSKGTLNEDSIICGYHGLTFNDKGQCSDSPTQRGMMPKAPVGSPLQARRRSPRGTAQGRYGHPDT